MATAEFSKFAGMLNAALSQHRLLRFEIALLEFLHLHFACSGNEKTKSMLFLLPGVSLQIEEAEVITGLLGFTEAAE